MQLPDKICCAAFAPVLNVIFKWCCMSDTDFELKPDSDYLPISSLWCKDMGFLANMKHLLLELVFGLQITELISDSNSVQLTKSGSFSVIDSSRADNGYIDKLCKFIPPTYMTKYFEAQLCRMLHKKYVEHYQFLIQAEDGLLISGSERPEGKDVVKTPGLYRFNKLQSAQLAAYRGKLHFIWTTLETLVATVSWLSTKSLEITLLLTGLTELFKRFRI